MMLRPIGVRNRALPVRRDWTPTILGTSTAGTQTYAASTKGRATMLDRAVLLEGIVILTAKDAATAGDIRIGGLPFTISSGAYNPGFAVTWFRNIDLTAGYSQIGLQGAAGTTQIALLQSGDNVGELTIAAAAIGATTGIAFSGVFTV